MFSVTVSGAVCGVGCFLVRVEVDCSGGLPGFELVGLPGSEVREARERVRVALHSVGAVLPPRRITVNLSPADRRKQGSAFDLPIAAGMLICMGRLPAERVSGVVLIGELGLDGRVRPLRGVLPVVLEARRRGFSRCVVPAENAQEAALVEGQEVLAVSSLQDFLQKLENGWENAQKWEKNGDDLNENAQEPSFSADDDRLSLSPDAPDFAELGGAQRLKRCAEIAAAGFHHMLMLGPPGSGKTLAARCMPGILPPLTAGERLEVAAVYSVAGFWKHARTLAGQGADAVRPFVSPHHTATPQALSGGGTQPRPGAVTLAHRGVLFLDEMTEWKRATLELLRQPLEERQIHIARARGGCTYPADFMLVGAANPCPCGYYPDRRRCRCRPEEVRRYLGHISGPILDRMDLCVETSRPAYGELLSGDKRETSAAIRARVMEARARQERRFAGQNTVCNARMSAAQIREFCKLDAEGDGLLQSAFERGGLSARSCHRILRTARTIADLDGKSRIAAEHLCEALSFRSDLQREEAL